MAESKQLRDVRFQAENRLRSVRRLPATGRNGDRVLFDGTVYEFVNGRWSTIGGTDDTSTTGGTAPGSSGLTQAQVQALIDADIADFLTQSQIDARALAVLTAALIKERYESNDDTNALTDALKTKLEDLVDRSLSDLQTIVSDYMTAALIKERYESNDDTNALTDDLLAKIEALGTDAPTDADDARADVPYFEADSDGRKSEVKIKSSRKAPFFDVTVANLGDGHRGYADSGYDGLGAGFGVNQGGSSGYSGLGAISEQLRSIATSTFSRVGTYTIVSTTQGLASHDNALFTLNDFGGDTQISKRNPETGVVLQSFQLVAESEPQGFTILDSVAYFYGNEENRFYTQALPDSGSGLAPTALSTAHGTAITVVYGMANLNDKVYVAYRHGSNNYRISELDTTDGSFVSGTTHTITGAESDDSAGGIGGFTSVNNALYVSTKDTSSSNPHLYEINPNNGNLTLVDDISPSNADIRHLAAIGDFIYGWNAIDNGIYRAEAEQGNRWVATFADGSPEVDADETALKLFTSPGADEITLDRVTEITAAIVFANDYDGATAHTISVNDDLDLALYNSDDEQLYEGSNEAVYATVAVEHPRIGE